MNSAELIGSHRENNFDALRIFAATLVIFSHSWALSGTHGEPIAKLVARLGVPDAGALGVWIFFVISGYLVTGSFVHRHNLAAFIEARVLRIYPAFIACLLFGLALGWLLTPLSSGEYWRHPLVEDYFFQNLQYELHFYLPGVFESNPFPRAVNGSIWTLPAESMMYVLVAVTGTLGVLKFRWAAVTVLAALLAMLAINPASVLSVPYMGTAQFAAPASCFLLGMLFFILRGRIPLRASGVLVLMTAVIMFEQNFPPGKFLVSVLVAYSAIWLALHPRLRVGVPAWIGDISYGLYLFAFPIQQTLICLWPEIGAWRLFVFAFALTSIVAWISWHGLEKRALALKGRMAGLLRLRHLGRKTREVRGRPVLE